MQRISNVKLERKIVLQLMNYTLTIFNTVFYIMLL